MDELIFRLRERVQAHREQRTPVGSTTIRARPPATADQLRRSEEQLGFRLPLLLRRVYLEVGNGGFGPGYGLIGVEGGFTDDRGQTIADVYESYVHADPDDPTWIWPPAHVPICHWGCGIYSIVDCRATGNSVSWADTSVKTDGEPMSTIIHIHKTTFDAWIEDWIEGKDLWTDPSRP